MTRLCFFAPTILSLTPRRDISFFHVCLSNGNADGLGSIRRTELGYSLDILGVSRQKRWLLDHPELQDNITVQWDPHVIANVLKPYVSELKIDTILTFDSHGVSGHPNHKAIPAGIKSLLNSTSYSTTPRLFSLTSASVLTKYVGVGAVALAKVELFVYRGLRKLRGFLAYTASYRNPRTLSSETSDPTFPIFISGFGYYLTALLAMLSHHSQMVWFRWLYVGCSRYMWTNTWAEIRDFS